METGWKTGWVLLMEEEEEVVVVGDVDEARSWSLRRAATRAGDDQLVNIR